MAPAGCLVVTLAILLSLAATPTSAPVHQGRGGWTLNSAGYLLGPELHLPQSRDRSSRGKEKPALEVLDLWKATDGRPKPHPQRASGRSPRETLAKPETAGTGELSKKAPGEGGALGLGRLQASPPQPLASSS